ncbi:MAG: ABC-F family ATP-binding cassette domain-containing protein [Phyllobacteriaceae bacterium]|nr:ABC-F family ATP-binding cassette domain-containing protein [Phyllobacteriaceae bacterium]
MLTITDLTLRIAGRPLLENAILALPDGAKAGLVGRNGTGKTTLFKAITGEFAAETGAIGLPKNARVGQVAQEAPATDEALIDIVLAADLERAALLAEEKTATDPHRIADIHMRLADIDAHSAEARAAAILSGLGFDHEAQRRPASAFSGGWRMRVALAAILFSEPDLLLLDEPTNYLDLEGVLWLQDYLRRYPHTVLIISHDRDLLNTAVTSIVHLEERKLTFWRGGYDQFERQRSERAEALTKSREKQEAAKKHMEAFVARFRAKASKARQAQSRLKMLEKMAPVATMLDERTLPIGFTAMAKPVASPIIALKGVEAGYAADKPVLRNLDLRIDHDDRIALLGANGNGKSTFAKLISGRLDALSGTITKAPGLKIAYFAQHQMDELRPDETPVAHVRLLMPMAKESEVRARVAKMGLTTEKMATKARDLSGGEKARLLMGLATFGGAHLIILDEPTNHLDIDSRSALIEALNDFPGAVILISHDRHLIDATAERLWLVRDGAVNPFDGDLDEYRRIVTRSETSAEKARVEDRGVSKADQRRDAAARREALKPLAKKIKETESLIEALRKRIQALDAELHDPALYAQDAAKTTALAKIRADKAAELADHEEAWLHLSDEYETGMTG